MLFNKRSRSLHSSKQLQKKRKKNIVLASVISTCIIILLILFVLILRLNFLQISSIEVKGATTFNSGELEQRVLALLSNDAYLYVIPKSNSLLYPKSVLEKNLTDSYKKIDSLEISHKNLKTLAINIVEKNPSALVCEGFHEEIDQDENCFFADSTGYVFAKAPQFSNGVYIRYYITTDIGDSIIGTSFIDKNLFNSLQKFAETAQKAFIQPLGILIGTQGDYEMYSKNSDDSEMTTYFNDRNPFEKTASNLVAFWNDSKIKKKGATTVPIFDSINLRFGNNVFYVIK